MANCPKCGTQVSRFVRDGGHDTGIWIGFVEFGHEELFGNASAVWQRISRHKQGTLCMDCAKEMFPNGKFYRVYHVFGNGAKTAICGGINGGENYKTKKEAETAKDEMTMKFGRKYIVAEYSIERK